MFVGATTYASLTDSFLQGYRRYSHVALPTGAVDRYYNEVHRIAEALSARDVSTSEQDVADYFKQIQPKLAFIDRSQELLHLLSQAKLPVPAAGLLRDLFLLAGTALFPGWTATCCDIANGSNDRRRPPHMRCGPLHRYFEQP